MRIFRGIPLAWLQLSAEKLRLLAAVSGIAFAVMLMLMQLGFRDALIASATLVHYQLNGEVVLISPLYEYLSASRAFSDERLYEALGTDGVESIAPIYFTQAVWKNPDTGHDHLIELVGIDPATETFQLPAINSSIDKIRMPDVVLVDLRARPEVGPLARWFSERTAIVTEVNGRKIAVGGLFELGTGFGANGRVVTSEVGPGLVVATEPPLGSVVPRGTAVNLLVCIPSEPEAYVMPDLVGRDAQAAERDLEALGFRVETTGPGSNFARIETQNPAPGARVLRGQVIGLGVAGRLIQ